MAALFWRFILVVSWLFEDAISFLTSIQQAGWEGAGSAPQGCCIQPVSESRRLSYKHRNTETEHLCLKKRRDFDDTSGAAGSKNFICTFASFLSSSNLQNKKNLSSTAIFVKAFKARPAHAKQMAQVQRAQKVLAILL